MSGPKGYDIQLSAEVRRRQEETSARSRCSALIERRAATASMLKSITAAPHTIASVPDLERLALTELERTERGLATEVAALEQKLADAKATRVKAEIAKAYTVVQNTHIALPNLRDLRGDHAPPASAPTDAIGSVRESLSRCLTRIAQIDESARSRLLNLADNVQSLLQGGHIGAADRVLLELQTETEQHLRQQLVRSHVAAEAADLVVRAADLPGAQARALRARASTCVTMSELAALKNVERELRSAYVKERDRTYIVQQTRLALRDLGYEVGSDFEVSALAGQAVLVHRPDLPDHAVHVRFAAGAPRVLTRVIALRSTSRQRDTEVERITCNDLAALQDAWRDSGVLSTLYHRVAAGERPVERIAGAVAEPVQAAGSVQQAETLGPLP